MYFFANAPAHHAEVAQAVPRGQVAGAEEAVGGERFERGG